MLRTIAVSAILATGIVAAHLANSSDPVYYACVKGAAIRYDPGAAKCPAGYTKIHWNRTGPAGARGAMGATGAPGPAGPSTMGPSGLDVVYVTFRNQMGGLTEATAARATWSSRPLKSVLPAPGLLPGTRAAPFASQDGAQARLAAVSYCDERSS